MELSQIAAKLQEPFPPNEIEWRVDRGQKTQSGNFVFVLAYVTNRAIMNRLDEVFGPFGWRNEFREWKGTSQLCGISIWLPERSEWVTKWDGSDDSNMDAVKGGISGAMKRTAVQWGIGRYLYNLDQNRVQLKERGENWTSVKVRVNGKEEYITGYWDTPRLPDWALPSGHKGPQKPAQPTQEHGPADITDDDLNALEQASAANRAQPTRSQQANNSAAARVYKLREEKGKTWQELNEIASEVLGREIRYLKAHVKGDEEWLMIERALKGDAA